MSLRLFFIEFSLLILCQLANVLRAHNLRKQYFCSIQIVPLRKDFSYREFGQGFSADVRIATDSPSVKFMYRRKSPVPRRG